jgi:O-succinylbenzoate synthase
MIPSIHRYELVDRRDRSRRRSGALLRFSFETPGYGDCHPWPEFGDLALRDQLDSSMTESPTGLIIESFGCGLWDSIARSKNQNLFDGRTIPPSHFHIANLLAEGLGDELPGLASMGFTRLKCKVGMDCTGELSALNRIVPEIRALGLKLRLDFNLRLAFGEVCAFLDELAAGSGGLDWLDWIEDPCPLYHEDWRKLRARFRVRLALDFADNPLVVALEEAVDVVVLKPAIRPIWQVINRVKDLGIPVCITSYLDHPVGQVYAAYRAAEAQHGGARLETCGLLTHDVYEPNAFSERLKTIGPVLIPPEGTGLGFDDLLEALPWQGLD